VTIFIKHGRSNLRDELKDHLHERHHFRVVAYETGARAGYTITELLDGLVKDASFALLVHTGEDEGADGAFGLEKTSFTRLACSRER